MFCPAMMSVGRLHEPRKLWVIMSLQELDLTPSHDFQKYDDRNISIYMI